MKAALIGTGMVSDTYADAFANTQAAQLTHVAASTLASAQAFCTRHSGLGAKPATLQQIVDDPGIDFVLLTTPPNARAQIVAALVAAGKPILMEKPVERTLANATALVAQCDAAGVPLGIMLQHRARPVVAALRRVLPSLGTLHMVEVNVPWWRPQSYYDAPGRGSYARDGGGVLISQAIHTLDLMLSLTQPLAGPVQQVTAMQATTGFHKMEAEDFVSAGLHFTSGAVGQLFATTASFPGKGETITLHCQEGSAHLEAGQLYIAHANGQSETIGAAATSGAGADPMAFTSDWHRSIIEDFVQALLEKRPPLVPGQAALAVHALIDALECSARAGQRVSLDIPG